MKKFINKNKRVLIKLESSDATVPTKGYEGDAGFDLRAVEDVKSLAHKQ